MSREKSEKVCITFRLSEEEHEKLKQYSSACGLSTAEFMRQLCRGNAPQPQPEKEFWELLGTLYEVHVAFKKCIPYAPFFGFSITDNPYSLHKRSDVSLSRFCSDFE